MFKKGHKIRTSNYNLPFRNGYRPHFSLVVFKKVAFSSKKHPISRPKRWTRLEEKCYCYQKSGSESFNNGTVYRRVGFLTRLHNILQTIHSTLSKTFYRWKWIWRVNGRLQFRKTSSPSMYQNVTEGKLMLFGWKKFKLVRSILAGTRSLSSHHGHCWRHEHSHSRKKQSQR